MNRLVKFVTYVSPWDAVISVAIIGAMIPAAFWGIYFAIVKNVPTFCGISRLWQDTISGAIWLILVAIYTGIIVEEIDELSENPKDDYGPSEVSLKRFIAKRPWHSLAGLFLIVDFIITAYFFSLAVGLAAIAVLMFVIWFLRLLLKLLNALLLFIIVRKLFKDF